MSEIADRLRRLRLDAGRREPAAVVAANPNRLDSLRGLLRLRERAAARDLKPPAGTEIAPGVRYVEEAIAFDAAPTILVPRIADEALDRRRLLCFDTETTGLAGGVGTRAFMIGVAAWDANVLTIRQLYLTTIAGETAMLKTFADWLLPDTILVSYNGKSYDAPLLKGRLRLNRVAHRLADLPHIDWLHPTRRAYRETLPNCRLATIEREVLAIVRDDDLPGAEAPAAWLAYLRGQSSVNLARVLDHNRQDVITLMRLGDHLEKIGALVPALTPLLVATLRSSAARKPADLSNRSSPDRVRGRL
jgi:uncharacterized protein YprB with RNaseH-like and TPR domain